MALTRWSFSSAVKAVLGKLQLNHNKFNTHNLQIRAATAAKEVDLDIKIIG